MFKLLVLKKEQDNANSFLQNSVINCVGEFRYSPEEEVTFATYFCLYEEVFQKRLCYMIKKFGQSKHKSILTTYFREIQEIYRLRRLS